MPTKRWPLLVVVAVLTALGGAWSASGDVDTKEKVRRIKPKNLPPVYQQWLEDVRYILTKEERNAFLGIAKDYQRDAFIRRFWESRDPTPGTQVNEFEERYYTRLGEARREFEYPQDERRKIYVLHGDPSGVFETDCGTLIWPLEIWQYGFSEVTRGSLTVLYFQPNGGGPFLIWRPTMGYKPLFAIGGSNKRSEFYSVMSQYCAELWDTMQELLQTFATYERENPMGALEAEIPPRSNDPEWLYTFHAFSTDAPAGATPLVGELEWVFPGERGFRTVVEGRYRVDPASPVKAVVGESESYNFQLTGEVLREGELFESFRYRFDIPSRQVGTEPIDLSFERYLRAGSYDLVLKLEDLNGGGVLREQVTLDVPQATEAVAAAPVGHAEESVAEQEAVEEARIELFAQEVELKSGLQRFAATASGDRISKVQFLLDDKPVLTKTRPPYSVELDLGNLPISHTVRVLALDRQGNEIATDELLVNVGEHTFVVRLVEPRRGERYSDDVRARAEVRAPQGQRIDRVEFFLGNERVATVFQAPYEQSIQLGSPDLAFVRAVAFLEDGNSSEDLVVFNTSQYLEDVSVKMVELFATVVDERGRPVDGLVQDQFSVSEEGQPQSILRFERLDDLPIYAALLLDTSASMAESLPEVRRVALGFLQETITPRDRAAVITFSETPRLATEFTNDAERLAGGLAGLTAERSTALYDSVLYGLYYFKGVKGQRALIVLSDGEDRRSEATYEQVLDFARSSGVTIYTIGFKLGKSGRASRNRLTQMAVETGGQAFFVQSTDELERIYAAVQTDLRSRYLLVYQPEAAGGTGFRRVAVNVAVPGAEVRTMSGYLP